VLAAGTLIVVTGLCSLFGVSIQRWNGQVNPWDGKSHWDGTRQFAYTFAFFDLLFVFAVIHFYPQLEPRWSASLVAWLCFHLAIWYTFWALLSPTYALVAERIDPRKRTMRRVRAPFEQVVPKPAPLEESGAPSGGKKKPTAILTASSAPPKKKRTRSRPVPAGGSRQQKQAEQQRRWPPQLVFVQAPLVIESESSSEGDTSPAKPAAVEPPQVEKPERRKPEPLDNLF
jgi:hypothetical protein